MWMPNKNAGESAAEGEALAETQATTRGAFRHIYGFILQAVKGDKATADAIFVLRFREYVEAANRARQRAHSERNPHAKQILQEIKWYYYRLVEIEKWMVDQQPNNRPFAHFGLFDGHDARTAMREDIVPPSADQGAAPERLLREG